MYPLLPLKDEGPFNCGICGEHRYGNEIWWDLDGIRCSDCWQNIKEGVIPYLKDKYGDDADWFGGWQIQSNYGVHSATARKLKKDGLLKGRYLKRQNGTVYYTIYLKSENREFLNKYPKIESKVKITIMGKDGDEINL